MTTGARVRAGVVLLLAALGPAALAPAGWGEPPAHPSAAERPPGTPVRGGALPQDATELDSGLYVVDPHDHGGTSWFRVDKHAGGRVWYGLTGEFTTYGQLGSVELDASRTDGEHESCGPQEALHPALSGGTPLTTARSTDGGPCESATSVELAVRTYGEVPADTRLQLSVWVEPSIANRSRLPAPIEPRWRAMADPRETTPVAAGTDAASAPLLESGHSYTVTAEPDQSRFVAVRLGFGQHAQIRARTLLRFRAGAVDPVWISPLGGDTGTPIYVPDHWPTLLTDRLAYRGAWVSPMITSLAEQDRGGAVAPAVPGTWYLAFVGRRIPRALPLQLDVRILTDSEAPQPLYAVEPDPVTNLAGEVEPVVAPDPPAPSRGADAAPSEAGAPTALPLGLGAGAAACALAGLVLLGWGRRQAAAARGHRSRDRERPPPGGIS